MLSASFEQRHQLSNIPACACCCRLAGGTPGISLAPSDLRSVSLSRSTVPNSLKQRALTPISPTTLWLLPSKFQSRREPQSGQKCQVISLEFHLYLVASSSEPFVQRSGLFSSFPYLQLIKHTIHSFSAGLMIETLTQGQHFACSNNCSCSMSVRERQSTGSRIRIRICDNGSHQGA